jgi:glycosyltransferase involved in cell wall biosynthesis
MRIAFVSYEYPPDTGLGGIATYVYQIARSFSNRGVEVHVVCGTNSATSVLQPQKQLTVHKINCASRSEFARQSPKVLQQLHQQNPLDLIEAPEYGAESLYIKDYLPAVPLMVKLHTPAYLIKRLNDFYFDQQPIRKLKAIFASYNAAKDPERTATLRADFIATPSVSLGDIIAADWNIKRNRIIHAPYPYIADPLLMEPASESFEPTVLYIGRLETRKGVWNLSKALPIVAERFPQARFIFVGKNDRGPFRKLSMKEAIMRNMEKIAGQVTFVDHVSLTEVYQYLRQATVCVFPSLWENYPNVCLEAMAAGCGIVASQNGGMQEMLEPIQGGLLINPNNIAEIAGAICRLLEDPVLSMEMGMRNQQQLVQYYTAALPDSLIRLYQTLAFDTAIH